MARHPIRLLALDIDGTLLNSHFQISAADLRALQRCHQEEVEIILATGRRHSFALPIAQQLGFDVLLITSNGAVTRWSHGERVHHDYLPAAAARLLTAHMDSFRDQMVLTFDRDERGALVLEDLGRVETTIARWVNSNAAFIEVVKPIEDALTTDPVQAMFCGSIEHMAPAEARLTDGSLSAAVTVLKTQYEARDLTILDVLNRDCSKGHALRRWADARGYAHREIMVIGDNYNDFEMLEIAGYPFVMGNASADIRGRGWPLTLSNDHSGVAAAIACVLDGVPIAAMRE